MGQVEARCIVCSGTDHQRVRAYRSSSGDPVFADRIVARCDGCGLEAAAPMPSDAALEAYYASGSYDSGNASLAQQSSRWQKLPGRAEAQRRFVAVDQPAPRSWLDIGSGYGFLLDAARRAGAARTTAVEATPSRVAELKRKGHEHVARLDEAPEGAFDVVSMSHLLEHVADPVAFLRGAQRALAPGGVFFCEVPNAAAWAGGHDDPHVIFFEPATLARTFEAAGLRPSRIETAGVRVDRPRALRVAEARAWTLVRRMRPPERFASSQPEFRSSPRGRLVVRAVARRHDDPDAAGRA